MWRMMLPQPFIPNFSRMLPKGNFKELPASMLYKVFPLLNNGQGRKGSNSGETCAANIELSLPNLQRLVAEFVRGNLARILREVLWSHKPSAQKYQGICRSIFRKKFGNSKVNFSCQLRFAVVWL